MSEGRYVCPRCGSHLIWSHNGASGQKTQIICGNNPAASRINFNLREVKFCFWKGICEKNKKGKIQLKDSNGRVLWRKSTY